MKQIRIGNVKIDNLCAAEAVDFALDDSHAPCFVVTPNAVMLEKCRHDPTLVALLNRATLSLADGVGVVRAARRIGTPLVGRVAGIEFGEALLFRAEQEGLRVFLLGGEDGIAARAAERLQKKHPALCICGTYWGYFEEGGEEECRLISALRQTRPDLLFVCMGFPLQEQWISANLDRLSELRVIAGLGGSLDVWAGKVRRAPRLFSRMGLEWAWRMAHEPKKRLSQLPLLVRFSLFGHRG
ncbi:MAG: WecB/TagA/CpsF family glycosyltransferase [Ruminococcaceae bacterium]|nr:WecB/TagA/CpsF family glycosyltransferase [Oscillospiraceae bacterium]